MVVPIVATGLLSAAFLLGLIPGCVSTVGPQWGATLGWTAAETQRRLRRGFILPTVILLPMAGWLCDLWGAKDVTLLGLLVLAAGVAILAVNPNSKTATSNLLGVALGVALLAVGSIAWMPTALSRPGRAVEALNLGFIAIGLGWLLGPQLTSRSISWIGLHRTFFSAAVLALISFGLLATSEQPPIAKESIPQLTHDLRFWLLILAAALYLPVECCLESWSGPFLRDLGDRRRLQSHLFVFWCAYLSARFATFWLLRTGTEPVFLLTCAAVSAMILGNLVGTYGPSSGRIGFWLVGFCYGPLLPGFLGLFGQTFPDHFGGILGVLLAAGTIYNTILSPALHRYALHHTPREAMRVPVVLTLLVAAPLLLVSLMR